MEEYAYIYKMSEFRTKRHKNPFRVMYYLNPTHGHWVFETREWFDDLVRIEYIKVSKIDKSYVMAFQNNISIQRDMQFENVLKELQKNKSHESESQDL